jgi:hypothetical protein
LDQNWTPTPSAPLHSSYYEPRQQQPGFIKQIAAAGGNFQRIVGDSRQPSKLAGECESAAPAEPKAATTPMTGVFNGNTPFQLPSSNDKRFKSLPPTEMLPRHETLGGYIFVCNNDTMQEDLKRQLFGLPQRYRDSVRAIQPGLPLFLYNYTTHQLHGIFEASSFGGSNIDPTAWEDKKCRGESRFPAQVRIRIRKQCKPLEEDSFRPVLHHYDGPKFRLQLSVPEVCSRLNSLCQSEGSSVLVLQSLFWLTRWRCTPAFRGHKCHCFIFSARISW